MYDFALHESVATKADVVALKADLEATMARLEHKIEIAVRDMTIRMGGIAVALFAALAGIKYFS